MQKRRFISILTLIMLAFAVPNVGMAQEIQSKAELNVSGLKVTDTQSSSVKLEWTKIDSAETYRIEYGKNPVVEATDKYDSSKESTTNSITIENLDPNTTYYFSAVAFANNKAEVSAAYSEEVSTKTLASTGATTQISIETLEVADANTLKITFSEELQLPEAANQEVKISLLDSPTTSLGVTGVTKDTTNPKTLVIKTESQTQDAKYAIEFTDKFQNTNGTAIAESSRTDSFTGYNTSTSETTTGAMTGLKLDGVNSVIISGKYVVEVDFNESLTLAATDLSKFKIVETNNPNSFLNIQDIKPNTQDDSKYLLVTDEQKNVSYTLIMTGVTSKSGQTMSDENSIVDFTGAKAEASENTNDTTSELKDLKLTVANNVISLTWTKPSTDEKIESIKVYKSTDDGKNYSLLSQDVDPTLGSKELTGLSPSNGLSIKVTTLSGDQESEGQILKLQISETGPADMLMLAMIVAGGYAIVSRRKSLQSLLNLSA